MIIKLIFVYNRLRSNASYTVTLLCLSNILLPTTSGTDPRERWATAYPSKYMPTCRDVAAAPQTPQLGAQANFGGPS